MRRRNAELALLIMAGVIAMSATLLVDFSPSSALPPTCAPFVIGIGVAIVATSVVTRRFASNADPILLPVAFALSGISYAMIKRLDPATGQEQAGPQLAWLTIG